MRLKKLILHGFKSFADRTEFVFDSPITGIVGPNGCGKSNVVDAVKWVLGEQSAKSLRGDAMLDVIFNGSGSRKPAGMSEVVLVFENPQKPEGGRAVNLDADEVAVGRRLFRDGTSEYQLNNTATRLKDIRELFLDTGIGVDAYSVIEQGRVAAMLEANPEQRRLIFEEAAGISKFKARRKEAERKLEKVDANLVRVGDIVDETEKRLRSVKIQAGKARVYQEHSARLAELRLSYSLHEYHTHASSLKELQSQSEDVRFRLDDVQGDLARAQNQLAEKKEALEAVGQARQRLEYEHVQAQAQIQSARQRQQYAQQQLAQMSEQSVGFEQDKAQVAAKLKELIAALETENKNLAALTSELEEHRRLIDQRQQSFGDAQLQLNAAASQIEQRKTDILDLMRKLATVGSRIGAIEIERKNLTAQCQRLSDRKSEVEPELQTLKTAGGELAARLQQTIAKIGDQQRQLESQRANAAALGKQIAQVGELLGGAKEHRSGLISRQNLLRDLEARREGVSEGVKSVLRQRDTKFPFIRGLVADVMSVEVEHAHVVEAALDGRDQWLLTHDSAAASATRDSLEELEGRVNILCADRLNPHTDSYDSAQHGRFVRPVIELVHYQAADEAIVRHLLGRTMLVKDLADAAALLASAPAGYQYVTPAGEIVGDGVLRAGPLTAAMGLLSRRSELQALEQQIAEVDVRIEELSKQLAEGASQAQSLDEQISALRTDLYQSNTDKVEISSAAAQNSDRQDDLRRELSVLGRELETLGAQLDRLAAESSQLAAQRQDLETKQQQAGAEVEELTVRQSAISEELAQLGEQLTASRIQLGQVQEKQLSSRQAVQRQTSEQAELHEQMDRLDRSVQQLTHRQGEVERELQSAAAAEAALARRRRPSNPHRGTRHSTLRTERRRRRTFAHSRNRPHQSRPDRAPASRT